jgi:limonene-1,2-epoxide hydrolase
MGDAPTELRGHGEDLPMSADSVVDQFIACMSNLDLDGACALVTDDLIYDNVPVFAVRGPAKMRKLLGPLFRRVDGAEWKIEHRATNGSTVMLDRADRLRRHDKWVEIPVATVFEVRDEKISLWREYFEIATMIAKFTELQIAGELGHLLRR